MAKSLEHAPARGLHEADFFAWTQDQADRLRRRAAIDWETLAEEIEGLGRSERREIRSRMAVLLLHLLKWQHQPERRCHSWLASIGEQRIFIAAILADSPSLSRAPAEAIEWAFALARRQASEETGLPLSVFPAECPWRADTALDPAFRPGPPSAPGDLRDD